MRAWQRPTWFPSTTVPDITNRRAWNTLHVMTIEQSEKLKQAFASGADEHGYVSWVKCMQIAKDLGLEYEQVPCPSALPYSVWPAEALNMFSPALQ